MLIIVQLKRRSYQFCLVLKFRNRGTPNVYLIFSAVILGTLVLISSVLCSGEVEETKKPEEPLPPGLVQIAKERFLYPFYLYVPPELRQKKNKPRIRTLLVLANNTGHVDDDFSIHDRPARQVSRESLPIASQLKVAMMYRSFHVRNQIGAFILKHWIAIL